MGQGGRPLPRGVKRRVGTCWSTAISTAYGRGIHPRHLAAWQARGRQRACCRAWCGKILSPLVRCGFPCGTCAITPVPCMQGDGVIELRPERCQGARYMLQSDGCLPHEISWILEATVG